jgi:lipoprotein-anchoring transpeptidase ErfK/SrfK
MTPDYYSALRKAAAAPGLSDRAARHAFYERARRALENDLRNTDPPLREADIDVHIDALGAAIVRIERELDAPRRPPPRGVAAVPVPADDTAAPPRRGFGIALGALALIAIAGLGAAYLVVPRERARPAPAARSEAPAARTSNAPAAEEAQAPYILRQQRVYYRTTHPAGTVIVSRNQRFLYIVQPNQVAIRYAIGVGPECETISGLFRITGKAGETDQGQVAGSAAPGADTGRKPGAQFALPALYFGGTHAVHRTSEPGRIGQAARQGCFHAWEKDIADLYERVPLEERVVIAN